MPIFNKLKSPMLNVLKARVSTSIAAGQLLCGVAVVSVLLSSCSQNNPAARKTTLEKFCASVSQHVLDRNPATISESLSTLLHEELSDAARQKLEDSKVIPDSPITVLRYKDLWTKAHKTNRVDVGIVRATTPIEAKDVTFRVTGKDWDLIDGKDSDFHPFQFNMIVELTPDMDGLPRVLDLQVVNAGGGTTAVASDVKDDLPKAASSSRRKRRR